VNDPKLERFLASLYVDAELRARFLAGPSAEAARAGLNPAQCEALERIDRVGLEMASRSFARKRSKVKKPS
jgi:Aromatic-ring-opening dioxygenase LigAB, LigA subunit